MQQYSQMCVPLFQSVKCITSALAHMRKYATQLWIEAKYAKLRHSTSSHVKTFSTSASGDHDRYMANEALRQGNMLLAWIANAP